jgi:hypothetical protein
MGRRRMFLQSELRDRSHDLAGTVVHEECRAAMSMVSSLANRRICFLLWCPCT